MACGWATHSVCHKCHAEDFGLHPESGRISSNIFKQKAIGYHLYFKLRSNLITGLEGIWEQD